MLSIPEPCHEDFSKMTATQRGAFCGKCKIDTFDFRNLSDLQVNTILFENKNEHLCGRFTAKQLSSLNRGFVNWKNQHEQTFKSKFVLALILVFGLSLFSCDQQDEGTISSLNAIELTVKDAKMNFVNELIDDEEFDLTDYTEEEEEDPTQCVIQELNGELVMPGILSYEDIPAQPLFISGGPGYNDVVNGGMRVPTTYEDYLQETIGDTIIQTDVMQNNPKELLFDAGVYPNPTFNQANLTLDVQKAGQFSIHLFDMNGRLVSPIYSGELTEGRQNFAIDLSNEQSGIYLIKIISNGKNETVKLQKLSK